VFSGGDFRASVAPNPAREGERYIFGKNDGLQNQAVIYKTNAIDAAPEALRDPNTLPADGTAA